ncbi:uncharacterized protein LOC133779534 [Humulus lupulus]|uniref:uncharacterized protein LOC133779534 n=1 Tax=Humulus lupulus TaxID=3486 RepID=UPI002B408157|nr:uncharacterized protein LOC133779534 [Humulus lupulus]
MEFQVRDYVFLQVSSLKGLKQFGKKGKLSPMFVGPFLILETIGHVAYRLAFPPSLSGFHDVFHVSTLQKLSYEEQPVHIFDKKDKVLRNKTIPLVKVLWRNNKVEEATWELELDMRENYPELFR